MVSRETKLIFSRWWHGMARGKDHSPNWGGPRVRSGRPPIDPKASATAPTSAPDALVQNMMQMLPMLADLAQQSAQTKKRERRRSPFKLPDFAPEAIPKDENLRMAMDSNL